MMWLCYEISPIWMAEWLVKSLAVYLINCMKHTNSIKSLLSSAEVVDSY